MSERDRKRHLAHQERRQKYAGLSAKSMIEKAYPQSWPDVHNLPLKYKNANGKEVEPSVHDRLAYYRSEKGSERVWENAGCLMDSHDMPKGARGESNRMPNGKRWPDVDTTLIMDSVSEALAEVLRPHLAEKAGMEMKAAY